MTREEIHDKLEAIRSHLREEFRFSDDAGRLPILEAHLRTVGMFVDQIHDEAAKRD